jgi:hypothetical protein
MSETHIEREQPTSAQPQEDALSRKTARDAAYRRLALAILGLDVATLAHMLSSSRQRAA